MGVTQLTRSSQCRRTHTLPKFLDSKMRSTPNRRANAAATFRGSHGTHNWKPSEDKPLANSDHENRRLLSQHSNAITASFAYFSTFNSLVTENTPETELARSLARTLSISIPTTPTSVTWPFFTMMWIGGTA